jgi:hypothetical protein
MCQHCMCLRFSSNNPYKGRALANFWCSFSNWLPERFAQLNPNWAFGKDTSLKSELLFDKWVFLTVGTREGFWQICDVVSWSDCLKWLHILILIRPLAKTQVWWVKLLFYEWVFCAICTRGGFWQKFYAVSWIDCLKVCHLNPNLGFAKNTSLIVKLLFDEIYKISGSEKAVSGQDYRDGWWLSTLCWCGVLCWFL